MFDIIVNSPGFTEEKRVDGWNGLLDLMLLANAADDVVLIARDDSGKLIANIEIESRNDGNSYATLLHCTDLSAFAEKCIAAGFEIYTVNSIFYG